MKGGTLTATGGNGGSGGAYGDNNTMGDGAAAISGDVTVSGGTLTATGGNGGNAGDDIGYGKPGYGTNNKGGAGDAAVSGDLTIDGGELTATNGTSGTIMGKYNTSSSGGTAGASFGGTLTLGKDVTLYEGTNQTGTVLDDNNSSSREYTGDRKQNMYALYEGTGGFAVTLKENTEDADKWTVKVGTGEAQALPVEGLEGGETITITYTGTKKVKSVKVVKK